MHGTLGGVAAGVLFVLPSLLTLIALTWIYLVFSDQPLLSGVLYGIKPAVTAIVLFAAYRIGSRALGNGLLWAIAAGAFIAIFVFDVPFPCIVFAAGVAGLVGGRIAPDRFRTSSRHALSSKTAGPALIHDQTPAPPWAGFRWRTSALKLATGVALWALFEGTLYSLFGWQGPLTQMGWFFTKAALVTFGGAYAVLPYVYQGGVEQYGWLTGTQTIDGLALGETTPGPLIMIVAFVGFIGGWGKELFGPENLALAGMAGAGVATVFTFLPSFLFILIGAPAVEATRHNLRFTAPLTAITAAVVGVVVNLAVFFAWHVLWPRATDDAPFTGGFEWFALLISIAAFVALRRFRIGIVPVIATWAAAGLLYRLGYM